MIIYWLRNLPAASWTTLASAVERMGGQARLAMTLREKDPTNVEPCACISPYSQLQNFCFSPIVSTSMICLDTCVKCNILLLGIRWVMANQHWEIVLNSDGCFRINSQKSPQMCQGSGALHSASQGKNYMVKIYDHDGLFEGASSVDNLSSEIPEDLDLVIFVLKHGHSFDSYKGIRHFGCSHEKIADQ